MRAPHDVPGQRSLTYVGLGVVAGTTALALTVVRIGLRVERLFAEFGSALPALTQFVIEFRAGITLVVLAAFSVAVLLHRNRHAAVALVAVGLFQLAIAGAHAWAYWLPLHADGGVIK